LGNHSDGLVAKVFGLHSEVRTVHSVGQSRPKRVFWYDGPDQVLSNISSVDRNECDEETKKCKQKWLDDWQGENSKWNSNENTIDW